jgi:hypothetical protein
MIASAATTAPAMRVNFERPVVNCFAKALLFISRSDSQAKLEALLGEEKECPHPNARFGTFAGNLEHFAALPFANNA